eukprot:TRINITY_DN7396_c0_g1_i1.p1 TRINITY_DN7396_c0_g1~~TRINITY_DN7396_c0_g1_i1.p1  ORF type:complete len:762 (-),score=82.96 TRINITY_DN7396_c0_g1_i1:16-2301(-)
MLLGTLGRLIVLWISCCVFLGGWGRVHEDEYGDTKEEYGVNICSGQFNCSVYYNLYGIDYCRLGGKGVCHRNGLCLPPSCSRDAGDGAPRCGALGKCIKGQCYVPGSIGDPCSIKGTSYPSCQVGLACKLITRLEGICENQGGNIQDGSCYSSTTNYPLSCAVGFAKYIDPKGNCRCRRAPTANDFFKYSDLKVGDKCHGHYDGCPEYSYCDPTTLVCRPKIIRNKEGTCQQSCSPLTSESCLSKSCDPRTHLCTEIPSLVKESGEGCSRPSDCSSYNCTNSVCQEHGCNDLDCDDDHFCRYGSFTPFGEKSFSCWPILGQWNCDFTSHYAEPRDDALGWDCLPLKGPGEQCTSHESCITKYCQTSKYPSYPLSGVCSQYPSHKIPQGLPCDLLHYPPMTCDSGLICATNYTCVPKNVPSGKDCQLSFDGQNSCASKKDFCDPDLNYRCRPSRTLDKDCSYGEVDGILQHNCSYGETCLCTDSGSKCQPLQIRYNPTKSGTLMPEFKTLYCILGLTKRTMLHIPKIFSEEILKEYFRDLSIHLDECRKQTSLIGDSFRASDKCKKTIAESYCCEICSLLSGPISSFYDIGEWSSFGSMVTRNKNFHITCNPPTFHIDDDLCNVVPDKLLTLKEEIHNLQCPGFAPLTVTFDITPRKSLVDLSVQQMSKAVGVWLGRSLAEPSLVKYSVKKGDRSFHVFVTEIPDVQTRTTLKSITSKSLPSVIQEQMGGVEVSIQKIEVSGGGSRGISLLLVFLVVFWFWC